MSRRVRRKFPSAESSFITPESQVGYVFKLTASEDERSCMVATQDRSLRIIDLETFSLSRQIVPAHDSTITDIQPVPSSPYLWISASNDGFCKVWDTRQADPVISVRLSNNSMDAPIFGASVSSNGTCAVACGSEISLFKFGEWRKFFTYTESHLDNVSCLKFSTQHPDFLVSGGDDGLVNVYNTSDLVNEDNGQCPVITLNAEDSVRSFQLCGDKMFVFSTTESVSVWDTKSGTKIRPNEDSLRCHPLVASDETGWGYIVGMDQEGRKILVGNSAGKLVEFEDLQVSKIYDAAHSGVVRSCLYTRSGTVLTAGEDGYLYEWTESVAQQHFSGESVRSRSARSSASSRPY